MIWDLINKLGIFLEYSPKICFMCQHEKSRVKFTSFGQTIELINGQTNKRTDLRMYICDFLRKKVYVPKYASFPYLEKVIYSYKIFFFFRNKIYFGQNRWVKTWSGVALQNHSSCLLPHLYFEFRDEGNNNTNAITFITVHTETAAIVTAFALDDL